jgi:4,5-dihydroxyphthalate decarboxylase
MTAAELRIAVGAYPHTRALRDRTTLPSGVRLRHVEITPISDAFKPMCRDLAFDVAEMSITGYLLARVYAKGITAMPVFPVRAFGSSHAAIVCREDAGVSYPRDLEGRTVGARAYTGAASFWARAALAHEFDVDTAAVTWLSTDEEHVHEFQKDAPANAVYRPGAGLGEMLNAGELAAAIGISGTAPKLKPLIPDAREQALAWYRRSGVYQINHVIVVKDSILAENPGLAAELYDAFTTAKLEWLRTSPNLGPISDLDLPRGDPFPYGSADNRETLGALVRFAQEQQILPKAYAVDELFPVSFD